ncbi:MAG: hypothetical protein GEU82_05335 [Luteitalea sp.]|nr:hypothetical protein [Luteitalea sp.]
MFEVLRCPYCGGRLEVVPSIYHRVFEDQIHEAVIACHCCVFPVVDGIPVLHLLPAAITAREHIEAEQPSLALRAMVGLNDAGEAARFEAAARSDASTYRDIVEALGPTFEGGYFLYRFSDPTFVVADAVLRAVAGTVLKGARRAVDICGGSGHLTRSLLELSAPAPILADLYFAKVWLARRFTAPGSEPVCCDGNAPMPFARGAFGYAMCSDAFQYIWTKRQLIGEMARLVAGPEPGAVVINHTHNQLTWTPSQGQPLSPAGYRDLFETIPARIYAETSLFSDVVKGGPLDLSRRERDSVLDAEQALTIVASDHPDVYAAHPLQAPSRATGEYRLNPLYSVEQEGSRLRLTLKFPNAAYEEEYGACREYLPEQTEIDAGALHELQETGTVPEPLAEMLARRVVVNLPKQYY